MKSSTSPQPISPIAVLLVAPPKTGKSCTAAAFPDPYFLDIDLNLNSVFPVLDGKEIFYDQPAVDMGVTVNEKGEMQNAEKVYPYAMSCLKQAAVNPKVKTIVIDGLTKLSDFAIAHILSECSRMEGKRIEAMRIQDYGRFMSLFQRLITFLRSTGKIIVCTCHQTVTKDEMTQANYYALAMPGQLKDTFGGFFTDSWAMASEPIAGGKSKFVIRTRPAYNTPPLGTSIRTLDAAIDVTDKKPKEISALLMPRLGLGAVQ